MKSTTKEIIRGAAACAAMACLVAFGACWINRVHGQGGELPALNSLSQAEKDGGWKLLFDGRSLQGWRLYGQKTAPTTGWRVENGELRKLAGIRGGDIVSTESFLDFDLRWEWWIATNGNNGVKYLVSEERKSAPGHEYQMIDDARNPDALRGGKRITAAFYDVLPPSPARKGISAGQWNHSRVQVKGRLVEHWLNGDKVLEYELETPALQEAIRQSKFKDSPGFGAKISGPIMLTDHNDEARFRNIKIRQLSP